MDKTQREQVNFCLRNRPYMTDRELAYIESLDRANGALVLTDTQVGYLDMISEKIARQKKE